MTAQCNSNYSGLIQQLITFTDQRFGVYLDMKMGFRNNLKAVEYYQHPNFREEDATRIHKIFTNAIALDSQSFFRWVRCPPFDLLDPRRCIIHQTTLGDFKKNNALDGINSSFAIENCITDIFNYWKIRLKEFNLDIRTQEAFPIMEYLGQLRNRAQHDLYGKRIVTQKNPIEVKKAIMKYPFPIFKQGDPISLTDQDIEALVVEVREQLNNYFIPYVNQQAYSA